MNTGALLPETAVGNMRIMNVGPMEPRDFEDLVTASDLAITENRISVSLAKAIHQRTPCVVLRNSRSISEVMDCAPQPLRALIDEMERACLGSVFPFDVFPIWSQADLEELGIFDRDGPGDRFVALEAFGGEETAKQLCSLLIDGSTRERMRRAQSAYLARVQTLPSPFDALHAAPSRR
jgi:hypothetical protein